MVLSAPAAEQDLDAYMTAVNSRVTGENEDELTLGPPLWRGPPRMTSMVDTMNGTAENRHQGAWAPRKGTVVAQMWCPSRRKEPRETRCGRHMAR
jgi:hypothetical protein